MTLTITSYGKLTHITKTAVGVFILGKILERKREAINIIYADLQISQL